MSSSLLLWLLPLIPLVSFLAFYFSAKRGRHAAIVILLSLGSHYLTWIAVLVINQLGGSERAVAPILTALIVAFGTQFAIHIMALRLKVKGDSLPQHWKPPSTRYLMTTMMTIPPLAVPFVFWWLGKFNTRESLVFSVPMMLIGLAVFFFERSQYKTGKWKS